MIGSITGLYCANGGQTMDNKSQLY